MFYDRHKFYFCAFAHLKFIKLLMLGDILVRFIRIVSLLHFCLNLSLYFTVIGKGDVFGDSFWKDNAVGQSAANVRALTYCDLHTIKRDKLLEVLDFYQAFANSFARNLILTYNLRHRLIFRKVADVRREKELAERRKNEPQLDQNQDHLVRKIFSKFRRDRSQHTPSVTQGSDVEKGDDSDKALVRVMSTTKLSSVAEKDDTSGNGVITTKVTRPAPSRTSKWGRLLGSSSLDSSAEVGAQVPAFTRSLSAKDASKERPSSSSSSSGSQSTGSGNKVQYRRKRIYFSHTNRISKYFNTNLSKLPLLVTQRVFQ